MTHCLMFRCRVLTPSTFCCISAWIRQADNLTVTVLQMQSSKHLWSTCAAVAYVGWPSLPLGNIEIFLVSSFTSVNESFWDSHSAMSFASFMRWAEESSVLFLSLQHLGSSPRPPTLPALALAREIAFLLSYESYLCHSQFLVSL